MKGVPEQIGSNFAEAKYSLPGPEGSGKWITGRSRSDASNESCSFWKCFIAERCHLKGNNGEKMNYLKKKEIFSTPHLDQEVNTSINVLVVLSINNGSWSGHLYLINKWRSAAQLRSNDKRHHLMDSYRLDELNSPQCGECFTAAEYIL